MWDKFKTYVEGCFKSATMWMLVALPEAISAVFSNFDIISQVVMDDKLEAQMQQWLHADPKALAFYLHIIAVVAFISRSRSLLIGAVRK